ncbi:hypothetical protein ACFV3R_25115 [Streptomyces sp. NPDC059740]|uniref:hypothetical protein n=1 Tax=Streptomyces sp. NPDC059740 TaxID=3346926 RepID=UPI003649D4C9
MDATLKTVVGGELVELPGTIATVRQTLDDDQAQAFDAEVEHAAAADLPAVVARWALAQAGADDEDEALFALLEAGQDVGAVPAEDDEAGAA